jgi:hemerythrin-like domain-containing protein
VTVEGGAGAGRPGAAGERVVALGSQLRRVHDRIREVLDDAREGLDPSAGTASITSDLVVRCLTVCSVLGSHHGDEDTALFPWLRREHPSLATVLDRLEQDHAMIGTLLGELARAVEEGAGREVVLRHLDGVDAIMESHFRYEERELVPVLDGSAGDGPPLPGRFWLGG